MDITGLKPHELARIVQDEMEKLVPAQGVIDECVEEMLCLIEDDEVARLLRGMVATGSIERALAHEEGRAGFFAETGCPYQPDEAGFEAWWDGFHEAQENTCADARRDITQRIR